MLEATMNQGDLEAAKKIIADTGPAGDSNLTILVLRASLKERTGDRVGARETLDRAVEKFPNDPTPFFRRGLLLSGDPASESDALADLDAAIRLRPSHWQALQTRANMNLNRGRVSDALADLRTAVETNPLQDDVRLNYMVQLLDNNREPDAIQVGRDAVRIRPNDVALAAGLGNVFSVRQRWDAASIFFGQIWNLTHDPRHALPYLISLIRSSPSQLAQAGAVVGALGSAVDASAPLLMARAELRLKQGNNDGSVRDIMAAYVLSGEDPRMLSAWYQSLTSVITEPTVRLQIFDRLTPNPKTAEWHQSMRADTLTLLPERRAEGIAAEESLFRATTNPALKRNLCGMLQAVYAADKNYDKAIQACKDGLAITPDDVMLNNNAASYLTATNRAPDAVPYAEAAAKAAPGSHDVLDTLASALAGAGKRDQAIDTYEQAAQASPTAQVAAKYLLKAATLALENPDHSRARKLLGVVRSLLRRGPNTLTPDQTKELEEYERRAGR
jgi:tetratricopeptide (TPR) repeat protein